MHVPHKTLSDRGRKKFVNFETTIAYKKGPCGMCCVCNPPFENPGYGPEDMGWMEEVIRALYFPINKIPARIRDRDLDISSQGIGS